MKRKILSVLLAFIFLLTFGMPVLAVTAPEIVLLAASNISRNSGRLNSIVTDDGGQLCDVRFGYGTTSQANVNAYDIQTPWVEYTFELGQHPFVDVDSLNANDQYFFRAEITNDHSTRASGELNFTTEAAIADNTDFLGIPSSTSISLSWVKGVGADRSLIRWAQDSEPALVTDGSLGYLGQANSYELTGLTLGKTYYLSIWGESDGGFSAGYDTIIVTTKASVGEREGLEVPDPFPDWMMVPDATALVGLGPIYDIGNDFADALTMPRATYWVILYMIVSIGLGALVFMFSHSLLGGGMALIVLLAVGTTMDLIPFWIPVLFALFTATATIIRRRTV